MRCAARRGPRSAPPIYPPAAPRNRTPRGLLPHPSRPRMRYQPRVASAAGGQTERVSRDDSGEARRGVRVRLPAAKPARVVIEDLQPVIDGGRYRAKRCVGDTVEVSATIFRDGHDVLRAIAHHRPRGERRWREVPMAPRRRRRRRRPLGRGASRSTSSGAGSGGSRPSPTISPPGATSSSASSPPARPSSIGARRGRGDPRGGAPSAPGRRRRPHRARRIGASGDERARSRSAAAPRSTRRSPMPSPRDADRGDAALGPARRARRRARARPRRLLVRALPPLLGRLRRRRARSCRSFAELGVDVLYFPPIHPIGVTARKGRNDAPKRRPGRPRQPVGDRRAPRAATPPSHPDLGTIEDFDALVAAARAEGIEIALDFAVQCSADHPWLTEHPEWFRRRPDGTLKYAENPPKRYRDIYNVDFDCEDWRGLWSALRDVVLYWVVARRRDLPRRQPPHQAARVLGVADRVGARRRSRRRVPQRGIHARGDDARAREGRLQPVLHLLHLEEHALGARASTSRARRAADARLLPPQLLRQHARHPQRVPAERRARRRSPRGSCSRRRSSPSYGVYSGFENYEATPRHAGSEEYLDSEKYELKRARARRPAAAAAARG